MDNNDFEQQFTKNLKDSAPVVAQPMEASVGSSKLPLIVAIVLAVVTLVESIALIIALNNVNTALSFNEVEEYTDEELAEGDYYDEENFTYDEDFNITAFKDTCTASDGSSYTFDLSNKYSLSGASSSNGTYTVVDGDLIALSNSDKVLYYNGVNVADGLTIYECNSTAGFEEE